ncbi:hypothetical protein KIPB_002299 [Kipferlia bialata]|uniref:Uncharacterized protein n=1 Tax=Kipferlia bialata TaxID=797122 RepID=A0A9K3CS13_9EUKA|nr:hypothetical protein KIPB_002299 [Kipferlia bialata]|eukprot:g2299.t1
MSPVMSSGADGTDGLGVSEADATPLHTQPHMDDVTDDSQGSGPTSALEQRVQEYRQRARREMDDVLDSLMAEIARGRERERLGREREASLTAQLEECTCAKASLEAEVIQLRQGLVDTKAQAERDMAALVESVQAEAAKLCQIQNQWIEEQQHKTEACRDRTRALQRQSEAITAELEAKRPEIEARRLRFHERMAEMRRRREAQRQDGCCD